MFTNRLILKPTLITQQYTKVIGTIGCGIEHFGAIYTNHYTKHTTFLTYNKLYSSIYIHRNISSVSIYIKDMWITRMERTQETVPDCIYIYAFRDYMMRVYLYVSSSIRRLDKFMHVNDEWARYHIYPQRETGKVRCDQFMILLLLLLLLYTIAIYLNWISLVNINKSVKCCECLHQRILIIYTALSLLVHIKY